MPEVRVRDGEDGEIALRRFKRACEKAGIVTEARRREAYEKPTELRKRKAAAAVKRNQKKVLRDVPMKRSRSGSRGKKPATENMND